MFLRKHKIESLKINYFYHLTSLCKHCVILFNMFILQKPKETVPTLAPKTLSVAAAFNEDEDVS